MNRVLLAALAFLLVGNAAGAAVDESTTMAEERRLDTTVESTDASAAVRGGGLCSVVRTAPALALAAVFGLAARR